MKTLVAYFSASGVTKNAARLLAETAHADLFEIVPSSPYTKADLNWSDKKSRSSVEMRDHASRPPIAEKMSTMDEYDTIFLGFPIWWYTAPRVINTFLESCDFSGKTLVPFATSGGSGLDKAEEDLKSLYPKTIIWKHGKLLNKTMSRNELSDWVKSIR